MLLYAFIRFGDVGKGIFYVRKSIYLLAKEMVVKVTAANESYRKSG
jgi:hypothetical protein